MNISSLQGGVRSAKQEVSTLEACKCHNSLLGLKTGDSPNALLPVICPQPSWRHTETCHANLDRRYPKGVFKIKKKSKKGGGRHFLHPGKSSNIQSCRCLR